MATKLNLTAKAAAIERTIPKFLDIAAKDAEIHFKKSFDNQGFTDESLENWKPSKGKIRSLGAKSLGKKTLEKTGKLKRSPRILRTGALKRQIISDLPYSAIHNEGLMGRAWGKYSFKMPKRQFIGNSRILERRTLAKGIALFKTALLNG